MSRALRAAALVVLVLGATAPGVASGPGPAAACEAMEPMPGIGFVCPRADGLLDVYTRSGEYVGTTHGADPVPAPGSLDTLEAASAAPACVGGASGTYYARAIYARAFDDADGYATWLPKIRALVANANQLVADAGAATGARTDLKLKCVDGEVEVMNEVLPTAMASADFSTIVSDLKELGYTDGRVKHWVFYDDTGACSCGGTANMYSDDRPGEENWNNGNGAPLFAVDFGYDSTRIMLHELGHTIGAVQNSAPRSTGAGHCIDGRDTMCYNDGGPKGDQYSTSHCQAEVFDCGKNDYFDANPPDGSYLASHWNLGSRVNRYVLFGHPFLQSLSCVADVEVEANATCSFLGTDDSAGVQYVVDWGDGTTTTVPESGFEPANVTRSGSHVFTTPGVYSVTVHMVDTDGLVGNARTSVVTVHADITPPTLSVQDPKVGHLYQGCAPSRPTFTDRVLWLEAGCVRAEASDTKSGIKHVETWVNGIPRAIDFEAPFEMEVPLPRGYGLNALIEVRAVDNAGNSATFTARAYFLSS